ncbi:MAG: ATP synthase F1 subunit delta [Deltaproteobacteria bacterium]|nr:ATP synthase F1 subunit delta [Deltaproteobacteria bacterium]MBM4323178.1 ATP synthase F1 subunit delta [Deltaproteobacteria bacterium]
MPRIGFGKRYAQAAFELAVEKNELETWRDGLRKIAGVTANEELMVFLQSPRFLFDTKKALLQKHLGEIHPLAFNLALLLVHKNSLRLSGDIFRQYLSLLDAHRGEERAKVITAVPLDDEDRLTISNRLGEVVKQKIIIDDKVDSAVIGGFIARIGDMLIDASIRQRLETLKKFLVETTK